MIPCGGAAAVVLGWGDPSQTQLPAAYSQPNPTPVHTASLPDFVFLIHLSLPSQHHDGRSVLCGKMLPVERRGELFKPVFSPKSCLKDILNCVPFRGEHAQTGKIRSFQPPLVGHSLPCCDYCMLLNWQTDSVKVWKALNNFPNGCNTQIFVSFLFFFFKPLLSEVLKFQKIPNPLLLFSVTVWSLFIYGAHWNQKIFSCKFLWQFCCQMYSSKLLWFVKVIKCFLQLFIKW